MTGALVDPRIPTESHSHDLCRRPWYGRQH